MCCPVVQDYESAVSDCALVLAQEPHNPKALYRRAAALLAQGSIAAAQADVQLVLQVDPANAQAHKLQARLQQQQNQQQQNQDLSPKAPVVPAVARATHNAQLELDAAGLKGRAQTLLADGRSGQVVALLGKFLRADPADRQQGVEAGLGQEQFSALQVDEQAALLHLLAAAYCAEADWAHAKYCYDAILEKDPRNFRALLKRAEAQLQDHYENVVRHFS